MATLPSKAGCSTPCYERDSNSQRTRTITTTPSDYMITNFYVHVCTQRTHSYMTRSVKFTPIVLYVHSKHEIWCLLNCTNKFLDFSVNVFTKQSMHSLAVFN